VFCRLCDWAGKNSGRNLPDRLQKRVVRDLIIFVISDWNNWGKRITDSGREKETGRKMGSNRKRQVK